MTNYLQVGLDAAYAAQTCEAISPDDLEWVRDALLNSPVKHRLTQWSTDTERERLIKIELQKILATRQSALHPAPDIINRLYATIASFGPLDALLGHPEVTDVYVNDWDDIRYDTLGQRNIRLPLAFDSPQAWEVVFYRLVSLAGGIINTDDPSADATLPDGTRLNAGIPPYTRAPQVALRLFRKQRLTLDDLQARDAFDARIRTYLEFLIACRASGVVGGEMGTGKTTFLNALFLAAPAHERIVTAEDVRELSLPDHHWAPHYTKSPLAQAGARKYDLEFTVRDMLRKRGDRAIVGEVRGPEALPMILALSAGTCGWSSCHGWTAANVLHRLESFAHLRGRVSANALRALVAEAIDVVVMLSLDLAGQRCVMEIVEVEGLQGSHIMLRTAFRFADSEWVQPSEYQLSERLAHKARVFGVELPMTR